MSTENLSKIFRKGLKPLIDCFVSGKTGEKEKVGSPYLNYVCTVTFCNPGVMG